MDSFHSASDLIKIRRAAVIGSAELRFMLPMSIYREIYIHTRARPLFPSVKDIKGGLVKLL